MSELNIEVDINDNIIGLRPREDFYTAKYIHRSVYLILLNSKKEMLLQKRAATKKRYPNLYHYSVAGTVGDESYQECIDRETEEEIGIAIKAEALFKFHHFDDIDKAWGMVFIAHSDKEITPDPREISSVKRISLPELQQDIQEYPENYTPPFVTGMTKYFAEYFTL